MADYGITQTMHGYNPNSVGIGNSNGPRARTPYFVLHTQQAKSTAVNLAKFCNNSAGGSNPVAYNLAVDGRDTIVIVPLNEGPWAAADANNIGIHACFAGSFAEWTRGQWLDAADDSGTVSPRTRQSPAWPRPWRRLTWSTTSRWSTRATVAVVAGRSRPRVSSVIWTSARAAAVTPTPDGSSSTVSCPPFSRGPRRSSPRARAQPHRRGGRGGRGMDRQAGRRAG